MLLCQINLIFSFNYSEGEKPIYFNIFLIQNKSLLQQTIGIFSEIVFEDPIKYTSIINIPIRIAIKYVPTYIHSQTDPKFKGIIIMYDIVVDKCGKYVYNTCLGLKTDHPPSFEIIIII